MKIIIVILLLIEAGRVAPESKDNSALFPLSNSRNLNERNIVMQPEIFKPVITKHEDYTGLYEVSNYGSVKSLERKVLSEKRSNWNHKEKILSPSICGNGYYKVSLHKNNTGTTCKIHHLVWDVFGNQKRNGRKLQVDHIDNNKLNNHFSNLQLLTARENTTKYFLQCTNKTSKYIGVGWHKRQNKWMVGIRINGKKKHLGVFKNEYEAHLCYQKAFNNL